LTAPPLDAGTHSAVKMPNRDLPGDARPDVKTPHA